jgi:hypothetical protein
MAGNASGASLYLSAFTGGSSVPRVPSNRKFLEITLFFALEDDSKAEIFAIAFIWIKNSVGGSSI